MVIKQWQKLAEEWANSDTRRTDHDIVDLQRRAAKDIELSIYEKGYVLGLLAEIPGSSRHARRLGAIGRKFDADYLATETEAKELLAKAKRLLG